MQRLGPSASPIRGHRANHILLAYLECCLSMLDAGVTLFSLVIVPTKQVRKRVIIIMGACCLLSNSTWSCQSLSLFIFSRVESSKVASLLLSPGAVAAGPHAEPHPRRWHHRNHPSPCPRRAARPHRVPGR